MIDKICVCHDRNFSHHFISFTMKHTSDVCMQATIANRTYQFNNNKKRFNTSEKNSHLDEIMVFVVVCARTQIDEIETSSIPFNSIHVAALFRRCFYFPRVYCLDFNCFVHFVRHAQSTIDLILSLFRCVFVFQSSLLVPKSIINRRFWQFIASNNVPGGNRICACT